MAQTITVLSQKGGTGKTTAVRTLADVYRRIGLDVLCADLDPQGNLSDYFDVPADASPTMAEVLAGQALISSEAEYFSLQGVEQALEVVELAKDSLHPELDWLGVVLNIADMRLVHAREALQQLRERFGERVFDAVIRRSVRYAESAERGVSILDYAPDLGADYLGLADEVLARLDGYRSERERLAALRAELV